MSAFEKKSVRIGVTFLSCGIIANFIPALYVYFAHGIIPPLSDLLKIWSVALAGFGITYVVQPTAFYTMMGVAGSYIGWLSGNCADIRIPAITMAQKASGYETATPEGDVMATIGVAISTFVSIFIISVFTYLGGEVINNLPPFIKSGFRYLMPSLFGAVYMQLCLKHLKAGFITIILAAGAAFILKSFLHVHIIWLSLVCIAISIVVTQMVERKGH